MNQVSIFTDGACRGNQYANAKGGYGAIIIANGNKTKLAQGYSDTSNNRMELRAVIASFKCLEQPATVELFSDAKYICDAFNQNWVEKWKRNDWRTANRKPVKNYDLWQELLLLIENYDVIWTWVKGHNGHPENEQVDELACMAADSGNLLNDAGPTTVTIVNS